jgi:hypothetical protein
MNERKRGASGNCAPPLQKSFSPRAWFRWLLLSFVSLVSLGCQSQPEVLVQNYMILDDFSGPRSTLGTTWEGFSDRVMGGVSDLKSGIVSQEDIHYLAMSGHVSTRNNGGFIQVRLKVGSDVAPFRASRFLGVRIVARGSGTGYFLHARTAGMVLPWKYYAAPIPLSTTWTSIDIPWSAFEPGDFGSMGPFRPNRLKSLAIVAAKGDFDALIEVREIGFY